MSKDRGVLYITSGKDFISKAEKSAESVKSQHPELPITIYADREVDHRAFDDVRSIESFEDPGDSILTEKHFPYEENLFLDSDTLVTGDIGDLFELLEQSDLAAAHNPGRERWDSKLWKQIDHSLPDAFPEYNAGVIVYRDTESVRELFKNWDEIYQSLGFHLNQPAFRIALYESDITPMTLPPEYNFMIHTVGYACGPVRIFHQGTSEKDLAQFAEIVNSSSQRRVTTWGDYPCRVIRNSDHSLRYQIKILDGNRVREVTAQLQREYNHSGVIGVLSKIREKLLRGLY